MKTSLFLAAALLAVTSAQAQHYVSPYVKQDGTVVQGHYQTNPDSTRANNYSTQGNVNPYTGQAGTVNPYPTYQPQPIRQPQCGLNSTGQYICR